MAGSLRLVELFEIEPGSSCLRCPARPTMLRHRVGAASPPSGRDMAGEMVKGLVAMARGRSLRRRKRLQVLVTRRGEVVRFVHWETSVGFCAPVNIEISAVDGGCSGCGSCRRRRSCMLNASPVLMAYLCIIAKAHPPHVRYSAKS